MKFLLARKIAFLAVILMVILAAAACGERPSPYHHPSGDSTGGYTTYDIAADDASNPDTPATNPGSLSDRGADRAGAQRDGPSHRDRY